MLFRCGREGAEEQDIVCSPVAFEMWRGRGDRHAVLEVHIWWQRRAETTWSGNHFTLEKEGQRVTAADVPFKIDFRRASAASDSGLDLSDSSRARGNHFTLEKEGQRVSVERGLTEG